MSRKSVLHALVCLSPVLPLASAACGQGFKEQPSAQGEDRDSGAGNVLVGDASRSRDDAGRDGGAAADAHRDAPGSDATDDERADVADLPEASAPEAGAEAGAAESGGGCTTGSLTCEDGGCVPNDVHNCGACGVACSGGTPVCDGTQCVSGCPAAKPTLCDGTCVNTSDDPLNCGACSTPCTGNPASSQATCSSGVCGWQCDTGFTRCGSSCDDLTNDPSNCGQCGAACTGNPPDSQATCSGGVCAFACDSGYEQCGSSCLPAAPDTVHGVFVSPGGPTGGCGTADIPCGTISAALALLQQADAGTRNIVYVSESATPYADQVALPAGVTIEGGWVDEGAGQWSHPCALDPSQVVVQAPAGVDAVVLASSGGSATLRTLTLVNKPNAPAAGQSLYGVLVNGSATQLSLENVQIDMGAAGKGTDGSPGAAATGAVACTSAGDSVAGTSGPTGGAGPAGAYSASGYTIGGAGATGIAGNPGDNGGPGKAGASCTPTSCQPVLGVCRDVTGTTVTGGTGSIGCGGNGGQGGGGGAGGGSSIAVYAWGSGVQVSITNSSITPGNGGAGGSGGVGGTGAAGVAGAAGSTRTCPQARCGSSSGSTTCMPEGSTVAFGGAGGLAGGNGGEGGTGGGGAGGDSYCTYAGGGATITGTPQCTPAMGGAGGAPNGPTGTAAVHD